MNRKRSLRWISTCAVQIKMFKIVFSLLWPYSNLLCHLNIEMKWNCTFRKLDVKCQSFVEVHFASSHQFFKTLNGLLINLCHLLDCVETSKIFGRIGDSQTTRDLNFTPRSWQFSCPARCIGLSLIKQKVLFVSSILLPGLLGSAMTIT